MSLHPRIMLLEGKEEIIRQSVEASPKWRKIYEAIITESDNIINLPPVKRELTGRRLLDKSHEALHRIFYLAYSYRMTEEDKYFKRAEREMLAVAGFSDWTLRIFLMWVK